MEMDNSDSNKTIEIFDVSKDKRNAKDDLRKS
jgi:hypothetical protein